MGLSRACLWQTCCQARLRIYAAFLALLSSCLRLSKQLTTLLLIKRPARCVALSRHCRQWALRAVVLLLACQSQIEAAVTNVATPPPVNRTQIRTSLRRHPAPSSPWHISYIQWYSHLFMLLWDYGLTRPNLSYGYPLSGKALHPSMYLQSDGPPPSTHHSWNTAAKMVLLSNDIHLNPRLTAPIMAHHDPFHYATHCLLFGNDVETNPGPGPSHVRCLSLNVAASARLVGGNSHRRSLCRSP